MDFDPSCLFRHVRLNGHQGSSHEEILKTKAVRAAFRPFMGVSTAALVGVRSYWGPMGQAFL
eukprot:12802815-Alexandrium_andersonii.AAC.1